MDIGVVVCVKRLGLIVRSDFGAGLANQSWEMYRNLEPDATLVVLMGARGRGPESPQRYDPAYVVHYLQNDAQAIATMEEFLSKIDVLLSVETFYEPFVVTRAFELGVERVLYANAELLNREDPAEHADRYLWPASWGQPFPEPGEILPWPCSTDVEPRQEINWPPRFVHVGAPAFHDRNGSGLILDAAMATAEHCEIVCYGTVPPSDGLPTTPLTYRDAVADHWDLYRDADCLVLPRRYGCLSLPMLEAAAMGVPTLTTDLDPQRGWFSKWAPWLLIPPGQCKMESMKGSLMHLGKSGVAVYDPDPADLARAMDRLAARDDVLDALRVEVREWAETRSWDVLKPAWEAALR